MQISTTDLVLRTATPTPDNFGQELNGLLTETLGRYFAPIVFPQDGLNVCRFSLIYRDFDANDITARLMKKPFTLNTNTAFDPAVRMANVTSKGSGAIKLPDGPAPCLDNPPCP